MTPAVFSAAANSASSAIACAVVVEMGQRPLIANKVPCSFDQHAATRTGIAIGRTGPADACADQIADRSVVRPSEVYGQRVDAAENASVTLETDLGVGGNFQLQADIPFSGKRSDSENHDSHCNLSASVSSKPVALQPRSLAADTSVAHNAA